jgi:hypothetical protein
MIKYDIYIDDELAIPVSIPTEDKTEEYVRAWDRFLDLLPFTPEVIDYSSFGHTPELDDLWDGTSFISKNGSELVDISDYLDNVKYFALVLDGIVKWIFIVQETPTEEGFIAALLSEPTFKPGE